MARRTSKRLAHLPLIAVASTALLLTGCASAGGDDGTMGTPVTPSPEDGTPTNFLDLEIGDCFDIPSNLPEGEALKYSSCDVLHLYETYAETTMADDTFPGADAVDTAAEDFCGPEFESFVGESWTTSDYDYQYIVPSERTWNELGDRDIMCMATTLSALPWSGSAEGNS